MTNRIIRIDGACVYPEIQKTGNGYRFPEHNPSYRYAMIHDDILWASKDGKDYVMAICVNVNGKPANKSDILNMPNSSQ